MILPDEAGIMSSPPAVGDLSEWRLFFDGAADFVEEISGQYGLANKSFTEYAIER